MVDLAKSAIWYARHGWTVFPLRPRTKEPFKDLGMYSATTDTDQIMDWWREYPRANIGLHCGGCNLLAIDMDSYKDKFSGGGILTHADEETPTNLTGGGGTHLLYSVEDGQRHGNRIGNLPPGIDIRGWGGYIVLPPSIHPSGIQYRWEFGYGPHEIEVLPLPIRLSQILDEARVGNRVPGPPNTLAVSISRDLVLAVLEEADLETYDEQKYDGTGRRWVLKHCPFNPPDDPHHEDKGAFILIAADGHIAAGCQHERCRHILSDAKMSGWRYLLRQKATRT